MGWPMSVFLWRSALLAADVDALGDGGLELLGLALLGVELEVALRGEESRARKCPAHGRREAVARSQLFASNSPDARRAALEEWLGARERSRTFSRLFARAASLKPASRILGGPGR